MDLVTIGLLVGLVVALFGFILGGNFGVELLEGDSASDAWRDTKVLGATLLGAIGALVATGIVQLASILEFLSGLLGQSPIALTNLWSIGLGWLGITGTIDLSPKLFLVGALSFLGLALIATEVEKS